MFNMIVDLNNKDGRLFYSLEDFQNCFNTIDQIYLIKGMTINRLPFKVAVKIDLAKEDYKKVKGNHIPKKISLDIKDIRFRKITGQYPGGANRRLYCIKGKEMSSFILPITNLLNSEYVDLAVRNNFLPTNRYYLVNEFNDVYRLDVKLKYVYELDTKNIEKNL